jgi:GAF domain-containing protein
VTRSPARGFVCWSRWAAIALETGVGLAIIGAAEVWLPREWGLGAGEPHPFWALALVQSMRYGLGPGLVVAFGSSLTYAVVALVGSSAGNLDTEQLVGQALLLMLLAVLAGEFRDAGHRREQVLAARNTELSDAVSDLAQRYLGATEVLEQFEQRIVGQSATIVSLQETTRRLHTLDPARVGPALLELLQSLLQVEAASVYVLRNGRLVPTAHLPLGEPAPDPAAGSGSYEVVAWALARRRPQTIRDQDEHVTARQFAAAPVLMAAPLLGAEGEPLGIVSVERMAFFQFTAAGVRQFEALAQMAAQALENALRFEEVQARAARNDVALCRPSHPSWASRPARLPVRLPERSARAARDEEARVVEVAP